MVGNSVLFFIFKDQTKQTLIIDQEVITNVE